VGREWEMRVAELEKELAESQRMSKVWEDEYHAEVEFNDGDGRKKARIREASPAGSVGECYARLQSGYNIRISAMAEKRTIGN
jgi:hypothetical protein